MGDLDPEQQISIFRFCNPSDLWLKIPVVSQRSLLPPAHPAPEGMGCRWLQMVLDERLWCLLTEETFERGHFPQRVQHPARCSTGDAARNCIQETGEQAGGWVADCWGQQIRD